jgi:hypothetical protein
VRCGHRDGSLRLYSRFSRPESLLIIPSRSSIVLMRLSGPSSMPTISQKIWYGRESNPDLWIRRQEFWPPDHTANNICLKVDKIMIYLETGCRGREVSKTSRKKEFRGNQFTDDGYVVSLTRGPRFTPRNRAVGWGTHYTTNRNGCNFDSWLGYRFVSMYLLLPAALGLGTYSVSNRNEYQESSWE